MPLPKSLATLSISRSFTLIAGAAVLVLVGAIGFTIFTARSNMIAMKRIEIRNQVETATTIINGFISRAEKGELSEADAKKQAVAALSAARFDNGNYFIGYDPQGIMLIHANKEYVGTDRSTSQDVNGKFITRELISMAKAGGGYTDYYYPKAGGTEPFLKISYSTYIGKWQWIVASGLYVTDVDQIFAGMLGDLAKLLLPIGLVFVALVVMLSRRASKSLNALAGSMSSIAAGDLKTEIAGLGRQDEVGQMATALQAFKDAAVEKSRIEAEAVQNRSTADAERKRNDDERRGNEAERARAQSEQAGVVRSLAEGLDHLSAGDLTYQITAGFPAEYVKLKDDFNAAIAQLRETMTVISNNTQGIRTGVGEISQASDDLAQRTEQQSSSLEETAVALEEITATVRTTAEGAKHARDVVSSAKADATRSGSVVKDAVEAMSGIEKSSNEISQIIGVIDNISFQTNLLALNASVEAARAGDAGKGFAVVASEVRTLAQRSADAAREIKDLINASSEQVGRGVGLVGQAGQALKQIAEQIVQIDEVVSTIAHSAEEQATGIQQVNTAINDMDQFMQQNAAMVEEATAATHNLAREANELATLMASFRTGSEVAALKQAGAAMRTVAPKPASPKVSAPQSVRQVASAASGGAAAARKPQLGAHADEWEEF